jgi:hypothetical protein
MFPQYAAYFIIFSLPVQVILTLFVMHVLILKFHTSKISQRGGITELKMAQCVKVSTQQTIAQCVEASTWQTIILRRNRMSMQQNSNTRAPFNTPHQHVQVHASAVA